MISDLALLLVVFPTDGEANMAVKGLINHGVITGAVCNVDSVEKSIKTSFLAAQCWC